MGTGCVLLLGGPLCDRLGAVGGRGEGEADDGVEQRVMRGGLGWGGLEGRRLGGTAADIA